VIASASHPAGFRHEAFFYADAEEFLAGTVKFVREGLESEEAVLVAMPKPRLELLSDALNGAGERLQFADMEELGRNPARIIPALRDFLEENSGKRPLRGIGEPAWAGRSPSELDECQRHESLLNLAFDGASAFTLMCPYDTAQLDEKVIEGAKHSHPLIAQSDRVAESDSYASIPPDPFEGDLEPPPSDATAFPFTVRQLSEVRQFAAERAQAIGLDFARIDDLVLATNELATNSLQHGEGRATLRIWRLGDAIACQVDNQGRIDEQPLAGRQRPGPEQPRGRGLWLVNQLCDLVQIRSGDSGSVVARLQMSLHRKLPS
jgi:anti-sigma regulatory factor (Ser/Thr protein kinase)